jgi:hypothetical protein
LVFLFQIKPVDLRGGFSYVTFIFLYPL